MKKMLFETGVSDEIDCPRCGYTNAHEEYESRAEFLPPELDGKIEEGYQSFRYCPLCGWTEYEGYMGEVEDDEDWPDDPYIAVEPTDQKIAESKTIQNFLKRISDDDVEQTIEEYIMFQHDPAEGGFQEIKRGTIDYIFSNIH